MTNPAGNAELIHSLSEELLRVLTTPDFHGPIPTFTLPDGTEIEGRTETDVLHHLTARRSRVPGRRYRFPSIGRDFFYHDMIEAAGFEFVVARNTRNQPCRVLVIR